MSAPEGIWRISAPSMTAEQADQLREEANRAMREGRTLFVVDGITVKWEPFDSLDAAWREVEDVLPEGWRVGEIKNVEYRGDGERWLVMAWEFGDDVDYATVIKAYETEPAGSGRYSPPRVTEVEKNAVIGTPDLDMASTSYIERQNLTIRMSNRRMTRLTNAFSKKLRNHKAAMALHFANYNLCRVHRTLRVTPAMAANVTDHVWTVEELLDAVDAA